jgi:hypothetical protein
VLHPSTDHARFVEYASNLIHDGVVGLLGNAIFFGQERVGVQLLDPDVGAICLEVLGEAFFCVVGHNGFDLESILTLGVDMKFLEVVQRLRLLFEQKLPLEP